MSSRWITVEKAFLQIFNWDSDEEVDISETDAISKDSNIVLCPRF